MLQKDEEKLEEEEKKDRLLIFSLFSCFLSHKGAVVKSRSQIISLFLSYVLLYSFSFPHAHSFLHFLLFLSTFQYQYLFTLPDFYPHLSPLPSPTVTHGPSSLYIFLSDSSAGGLGRLVGGVAAISRAPLVCHMVRGWRRKRGRGGGCSVADPRWSQLCVSSSVLFSLVLSFPCMLLMAS